MEISLNEESNKWDGGITSLSNLIMKTFERCKDPLIICQDFMLK